MERIGRIAAAGPKAIILREKDLSQEEYETLAEKAIGVCRSYGIECVPHSFVKVAARLSMKAIHMPMAALRAMSAEEKAGFDVIGASCHSVDEVLEAQELGCAYVTAGHIFATDCKRGLEPRGIDFLREVCEAAEIPVYAIGGINAGNVRDVKAAGAAGACIMSGLMTCGDPAEYIADLRSAAAASGRE